VLVRFLCALHFFGVFASRSCMYPGLVVRVCIYVCAGFFEEQMQRDRAEKRTQEKARKKQLRKQVSTPQQTAHTSSYVNSHACTCLPFLPFLCVFALFISMFGASQTCLCTRAATQARAPAAQVVRISKNRRPVSSGRHTVSRFCSGAIPCTMLRGAISLTVLRQFCPDYLLNLQGVAAQS